MFGHFYCLLTYNVRIQLDDLSYVSRDIYPVKEAHWRSAEEKIATNFFCQIYLSKLFLAFAFKQTNKQKSTTC